MVINMNILVFNGSPKREKSDTMHMTRAFLNGMNLAGENNIKIVDVIDKNIGYCKGCFACKRNGGKCVQCDDMAEILNDILNSEVLLFSFPLYSHSMPAHLKALIDRLMPLSSLAMRKADDRYEHPCNHDFSNLRYVMICGCGFPNSNRNFDSMVMEFKLLFGEEKSTIITVAQAPMFNAPEAVSVTAPFLETVCLAGREYGERGVISEETAQKLEMPMIPEEIYAAICNADNEK